MTEKELLVENLKTALTKNSVEVYSKGYDDGFAACKAVCLKILSGNADVSKIQTPTLSMQTGKHDPADLDFYKIDKEATIE